MIILIKKKFVNTEKSRRRPLSWSLSLKRGLKSWSLYIHMKGLSILGRCCCCRRRCRCCCCCSFVHPTTPGVRGPVCPPGKADRMEPVCYELPYSHGHQAYQARRRHYYTSCILSAKCVYYAGASYVVFAWTRYSYFA